MPTVHSQLRHWCRARGYEEGERFATLMDEQLHPEATLEPDVLLRACRGLRGTRFFIDNGLDREEVAQELADYLEMPPVLVHLVERSPSRPDAPQLVEGGTEPPDLFVSYFHQDAAFVERLAAAVAGAGFTVWYDREGITAGQSFPRIIEDALEVTRYIGVVATKRSVRRPWVRREIDATYVREGEEGREILVPIRIDDSRVPLFMRVPQHCDFRKAFKDGLSALLDRLGR